MAPREIAEFPDGFVFAMEEGKIIGQLELSLIKFEGRNIGYVNLYYLEPASRGRGKGQEFHEYAMQFFKTRAVAEYHLRVAPTNTPALKFYQKVGMAEMCAEVDEKVIRMKGQVEGFGV
ncbi:GNAT family N-acetyltransferase [Planococcus shixiaomingii]|uniref:GNAT family N-acetyltransferase n=1 Tax=Planococcus shixiaomingii TaxID=3058393 RepID=UPI002639F712|nr:GNAT family N-acetyltransferase [Planococcus sp. N022]WKA53140.1 GNAT family N-acetyltransferase [Planococcus sp. N022]